MAKLDFNLSHLRYFYDAGLAGSIAVSSKKNFVTHSAVSQGIKRLESCLGVALLEHKKRQFILTNEGRYLLGACGRIFESLDDLRDDVMTSTDEPVGDLVFGSSHSIVSALLIKSFKPLRKMYPLMQLKFKLGKTPYIRDWVLNRQVEIGITVDDGNLGDLSAIPIKSGEFVIVSKTEPEDLSGIDNLLLTEQRSETAQLLQYYRRKYKKDLPVAIEVDSWELITQMAESGMYTGFVPDFVAEARGPKVRVMKLPVKIGYNLVAIHRKNEKISRNASAFIEHIRANR